MRAISVALLLPMCSCAAAFGTGPFMVPFDSRPPGAVVRYKNQNVGVTPCTIRMDNDERSAFLSLDGFHGIEVDVGDAPNGGLVFIGILLWGPFEIVVDAAAGAFSRTDDRPVNVTMTPKAEAPPPKWSR